MLLALLTAASLQAAPAHLRLLPSDEVAVELARIEAARASVVAPLITSGVGAAATIAGVVMLFSSAGFPASIALLLAGPVAATIGLTMLVAALVRNADLEQRLALLREGEARSQSFGAMASDDRARLRAGELEDRRSLALPIVLLVSGTALFPVGGFVALFGLAASVVALAVGPAIILVGVALVTGGVLSLVSTLEHNVSIDRRLKRLEVAATPPQAALLGPAPTLRLAAF